MGADQAGHLVAEGSIEKRNCRIVAHGGMLLGRNQWIWSSLISAGLAAAFNSAHTPDLIVAPGGGLLALVASSRANLPERKHRLFYAQNTLRYRVALTGELTFAGCLH
jgi:hypothetical protein